MCAKVTLCRTETIVNYTERISPERLHFVEPSEKCVHKGVILVRTIINPNEPEVALLLLNLSDDDIRMTPEIQSLISYPEEEYQFLKELPYNKMLFQNITEESNSPYNNRIYLVPKKDGSIRLSIDLRELISKPD